MRRSKILLVRQLLHVLYCTSEAAVASHSPLETKPPSDHPNKHSGEEFLLRLGSYVRDLRNRRGMSRKLLAQQSKVSERHLAQLETGEGNISILLLRRVASVLGVSLEELFAPNRQPVRHNSSQKQTLLRFIDRLPGYRAIEKRTLERVLRAAGPAVISVAGGIVSEKETYEYLLGHCYTVWLKAQPEEHMSRVVAQGDFRAMAGSDRAMEDLRRILESREPLYRKADATVDTSGESTDESFAKLKAALQAASQ